MPNVAIAKAIPNIFFIFFCPPLQKTSRALSVAWREPDCYLRHLQCPVGYKQYVSHKKHKRYKMFEAFFVLFVAVLMGIVLVDDAGFHDENNTPYRCNIPYRITIDRDDIRLESRRYRPDLFTHAERLGRQ